MAAEINIELLELEDRTRQQFNTLKVLKLNKFKF